LQKHDFTASANSEVSSENTESSCGSGLAWALHFYETEALKTMNGEMTAMNEKENQIPSIKPRFRKTVRIRTTMFDLIETLNEVVEKGEEGLIPQVVLHMANTGRLKVVR
jgi:hypothetical protein